MAMIPHQGEGVKVEGILGFVFTEIREKGSKILLSLRNRL